jgi:hypothetical protein
VQAAPGWVDSKSFGAIKRFIELTHDRYEKRLKPYFGNTIVGIFSDEPAYHVPIKFAEKPTLRFAYYDGAEEAYKQRVERELRQDVEAYLADSSKDEVWRFTPICWGGGCARRFSIRSGRGATVRGCFTPASAGRGRHGQGHPLQRECAERAQGVLAAGHGRDRYPACHKTISSGPPSPRHSMPSVAATKADWRSFSRWGLRI